MSKRRGRPPHRLKQTFGVKQEYETFADVERACAKWLRERGEMVTMSERMKQGRKKRNEQLSRDIYAPV